MATLNPFDLLDDDAEDPSLFIAAQQLKQATLVASAPKKGPVQAQAQPAKTAPKLPSKPAPPSQAVREARSDGLRGGRGGPRGGARGHGRGRGFNQEFAYDENAFGNNNGFSGRYRTPEDGESGKVSEGRGGYRGGFRGGRRGGFNNGDAAEGEGERPQRVFDRRSGTGRGNEFIKREGSGRGNWGTPADDIAQETEEPVNDDEKIVEAEKQAGQEDAGDTTKDSTAAEPEEKEPEKEMTLEEYEKLMEEKRKTLLALRQEERKVNLDKELESMQLLSNKKNDDEIFIKLGSEKDKRKETVEKVKKTKSINEFLKHAEGESYYRAGGSGRGRGRGRGNGSFGGGFGGNNSVSAPSIEDVSQFPSLAAK